MHVQLLGENDMKSVLSKFNGSLFPLNHFFNLAQASLLQF